MKHVGGEGIGFLMPLKSTTYWLGSPEKWVWAGGRRATAEEEEAHAAEVESDVGVGAGAARHARALIVAQPLHALRVTPKLALRLAPAIADRLWRALLRRS